MSAEEDLYTALSGDAGIIALVGTRVHIDKRDEDEVLPSIVFQRTGTRPVTTIHGTVVANTIALGVACVAETRASAEAVANAVEAAVVPTFILVNRVSDYDPDTQFHVATVSLNKHE